MDANGRVADRVVVDAMGWVPGERLGVEERDGLLLIKADQRGRLSVSNQGQLRLPAGVRRWRGLAVGERLLLAAFPDRALLVLCGPVAVEAMISRSLAGDPA